MITKSTPEAQTAPPSEDHILVRRLQADDSAALTEVWHRHSAMVIGIARRITRSDPLAFEVAQEVFTRLWQQSTSVDLERGTLASFLGSLARHRSVDVVRHEAAHRRRDNRMSADRSIERTSQDPLEHVVRDETVARVRAAVAALPPRERQAVELAWFAGGAYRAVAETLEIPEGTAKSRIRTGMRRVSEIMADDSLVTAG